MRRTPWIAIVLAVALLAWLLPWPAETAERGGRTGNEPPVDPRDASTTSRADDRTRTRPPAGSLLLRVSSEDGAEPSGKVYWSTSPEPPLTSSWLAPEQGYGLAEDRVRTLPHRGSARLSIPHAHWTWLRATTRAKDGLLLAGYRRVPPFEGEKELELRIGSSRRALHCFVVESDLRTPAREAEVALYTTDLRTGGPPRLARKLASDESGYVCFRELEPGGFLLCAPGSKPGDLPPHTARLVLPDSMPTLEVPCTLVVPERSHRVRLLITVPRLVADELPGRVYLRRHEGRPGQLVPVPGMLGKGTRTYPVELPPGSYQLGVLPVGSYLIPQRARRLEIPDQRGVRLELMLAPNEASTELELRRLEERYLPVTVSPRFEGELVPPEAELLHLGPYRWRHRIERVRSLSRPVRLAVSGRGQCWTSAGIVRVQGRRVSVPLVAATRLEIRLGRDSLPREDHALVVVSQGSRQETVVLLPKLVQRGGHVVAALVGATIVPRGVTRLETLRTGTLPSVTRTIEADRPYRTVDLD